MNFLAPAAFFLTLLLPLIVALYLLRLRRTEREVPSVYLWRKMVRDVEANAPWQRLRANLLLLLQLLFLIALIVALARPFTWAEGASGQALILILDTSASMGANDVAPTRLEAAKDQARGLVDSLPEGARLTVIAAGRDAQVLLSSSRDRRAGRLAIERIQLESGGSDMSVALELASAIAARQPDTEIVVLSDGRVDLPERLVLKGRLRYLPLGLSGENQAISLLRLEKGTDSGSGDGAPGATAFIQVSNYGSQPAARRLVLRADGQVFNAYDVEVPPGGQQALLVEDLPAETEVLEASLEGSDLLPADDLALAVQESGELVRVSLVSEGNRFLEVALDLLPGVERVQEVEADPDLTILDAQVPMTNTLPAGNLLFIAPPRSSEYFTTTGVVNAPGLSPAEESDLLLEHILLDEVSILDAVEIPLPNWARPVIWGETQGGRTPMLFVGEVQGRRVGVLAFDLRRSDLPLQTAFPLLWANLVRWLAPGSEGGLPVMATPGESLSFLPPDDAQEVVVILPDGERQHLAPEGGRMVFAGTDQPGLYRVTWGEGEAAREAAFAVNLFLHQESDLAPADHLPGLESAAGSAGAEAGQGRREWWRPAALLALGLLTVEWAVYQRAGLARLRASGRQMMRKMLKKPGS